MKRRVQLKRRMQRLGFGSLLLILPLLASAGGNSLLVPSSASCSLHVAPEDLPEALALCRQQAGAGDLQAEYELGSFYADEQNPERDLPQAIKWFEQASLQGHAQAQYRLGMLFWHGEGVPVNKVQAYIVLKMAAVNGAEDAADDLDLLAAQMSGDEVQQANLVLGQIFRDYLLKLQNDPPVP